MFLPAGFPASTGNHLLAALSAQEHERLLPHLRQIYLPKNRILYEVGDQIHYAYFLLDGMVSLFSISEEGESIEAAMIGNEGMIGIPIILGSTTMPYRSVVQIPAQALRISAYALNKGFKQATQLQEVLLAYTQKLLTQISQSAICNRFHSVEGRLCRWLLITSGRMRSDSLHLTQSLISQILGAPRTGVTVAAGNLQDAGLIRYRRGNIKIIDRQRLEAAACACYRIGSETKTNY
jgi:CRP-like cAMP-binding protein